MGLHKEVLLREEGGLFGLLHLELAGWVDVHHSTQIGSLQELLRGWRFRLCICCVLYQIRAVNLSSCRKLISRSSSQLSISFNNPFYPRNWQTSWVSVIKVLQSWRPTSQTSYWSMWWTSSPSSWSWDSVRSCCDRSGKRSIRSSWYKNYKNKSDWRTSRYRTRLRSFGTKCSSLWTRIRISSTTTLWNRVGLPSCRCLKRQSALTRWDGRVRMWSRTF